MVRAADGVANGTQRAGRSRAQGVDAGHCAGSDTRYFGDGRLGNDGASGTKDFAPPRHGIKLHVLVFHGALPPFS